MTKSQRILGIDPSIASSGYACIEDNNLIDCGTITTSSKFTETYRLNEIYEEIRNVIHKLQPDIVIMEDQYTGPNPQTSLYLARARGVAMISAYHAGCNVIIYSPSEIKKCITGKGNAKKEFVQERVMDIYQASPYIQMYFPNGIKTSGKLKNDDISDAIAIAYTHQTLQAGKMI